MLKQYLEQPRRNSNNRALAIIREEMHVQVKRHYQVEKQNTAHNFNLNSISS